MKKLALTLLILFISINSFALDKDKIIETLSSFKTAIADFEQITEIKDFGEDFYSGKIYLIAKKKALWDYTKPYPQYYIFTPDSMEYYDSSTEQLIRQKVNQSGGQNIIYQLLVDISKAKETFDIIVEGEDTLRLIPKTDIGLKYIVLKIKKDFISEIISTDNEGNNTKVYLKNIMLNVNINPKVFQKEVPLTTEIFER
jgi:outer membrane lipoprotein carrier protein